MDSKKFIIMPILFDELLSAMDSHHKLFYTYKTPDIFVFTRENFVVLKKSELFIKFSLSYKSFEIKRKEIRNNLYQLCNDWKSEFIKLNQFKINIMNIDNYYRVLNNLLNFFEDDIEERKELFKKLAAISSYLRNKAIKLIMKNNGINLIDRKQLIDALKSLVKTMDEVEEYIYTIIY